MGSMLGGRWSLWKTNKQKITKKQNKDRLLIYALIGFSRFSVSIPTPCAFWDHLCYKMLKPEVNQPTNKGELKKAMLKNEETDYN